MSVKDMNAAINEEIAIMEELKTPGHVNIVTLEDHFTDPSTTLPVIVLKYYPGGDLFNWIHGPNAEAIHTRKIPKQAFYRIMFEIAKGLQYVHSKDICHRVSDLSNKLGSKTSKHSAHPKQI